MKATTRTAQRPGPNAADLRLPAALNASAIALAELPKFACVVRGLAEWKQVEKRSKAFSLLGCRLSAATSSEEAATIILGIAREVFGWDAGRVHRGG